MKIIVNKIPTEVDGDTTVASLLPINSSAPAAIAVNGMIVPQTRHNSHILCEGDEVVIITAAFGG